MRFRFKSLFSGNSSSTRYTSQTAKGGNAPKNSVGKIKYFEKTPNFCMNVYVSSQSNRRSK